LNDRRPASKETRTVPKPHIDLAAATQAGERRPGVDLAVVVNGFPRLSETFVLHELLELERLGLRLHLFAMRRPDEVVQQEAVARLRAEVEYLPDLSAGASTLAIRAAHAALFLRRPRTYTAGLAEIATSPDFSRANLRRAVTLAQRLVRLGAPALYVHFAHKPATVARFASLLTGAPYGLSAHAKDIWLTPRNELARKVRDATVVLTCTSDGRDHLAELAGDKTPVHLAHHGVATGVGVAAHADGPIRIISIGRLVAKKGHPTLIRAAAILRDRGIDFELRIGGEGPEWASLQRLVHELEVSDRVQFLGPLSEAEAQREYQQADVFALACEELENGDRDGIPNVVLEAMVHQLPVAATRAGGTAEAVVHGASGLLSNQRDHVTLAHHLERLVSDGALRRRLATGAREAVLARFDRQRCLPGVVDALCDSGLIAIPPGEAVPGLGAVA
jgi:glycosyltransferase involved in cell wall biosynthesis